MNESELKKETIEAAEEYLNNRKNVDHKDIIEGIANLCSTAAASDIIGNLISLAPIPAKGITKIMFKIGQLSIATAVGNWASKSVRDEIEDVEKVVKVIKIKIEESTKPQEPDIQIIK